MNEVTLYEIYAINQKTTGEDLTVSLAKYKAEHPGTVSAQEDKAIRAFIGRCGPELARAYQEGREAFAAAVAAGEAE